MAKTDWTLNETIQPEDMNEIGQEINQLREELDHIEVPPASTTKAGVVQLSNAVNSLSETLAATPSAVKTAYDRAEQAFQLGNERKQELVDALIALGVSASTSESWDMLLGKVASVIRTTGNADASEVLSGRGFSNASANGLTGTMPNRGGVTSTLTSQGQQYTVPQGYHNGTGKVTANMTNLTAGNIRSGATVGGVAGSFSQLSNGATAAQILTGRSAAVNGAVINGTMANRTGHVTGQSTSLTGTTLRIRPPAGYYPGDSGNSVQYSDPNWLSENIVEGVSVFGKTGTAKKSQGINVQRGQISISSTSPVIVNIGSVDLNKSIVKVSYSLRDPDAANMSISLLLVRARFLSSSQIEIYRGPTASSRVVDVFWEVVEFLDAKRVQSGITTISSDPLVIPISQINTSKSFVVASWSSTGSSTYMSVSQLRYRLSDSNTLTMSSNYSYLHQVSWFVIEFD